MSISEIGPYDNFPGFYGNWCGPGLSGGETGHEPPRDSVDAACYQHDNSPGYSNPNATYNQVYAADQNLISDLESAKGVSSYGAIYPVIATVAFEVKDTLYTAPLAHLESFIHKFEEVIVDHSMGNPMVDPSSLFH